MSSYAELARATQQQTAPHTCECKTPTLQTPVPQSRPSLGQSIDDSLRDLEIDGYKIKFSQKVTLMPVDLVPTRLANTPNE